MKKMMSIIALAMIAVAAGAGNKTSITGSWTYEGCAISTTG